MSTVTRHYVETHGTTDAGGEFTYETSCRCGWVSGPVDGYYAACGAGAAHLEGRGHSTAVRTDRPFAGEPVVYTASCSCGRWESDRFPDATDAFAAGDGHRAAMGEDWTP